MNFCHFATRLLIGLGLTIVFSQSAFSASLQQVAFSMCAPQANRCLKVSGEKAYQATEGALFVVRYPQFEWIDRSTGQQVSGRGIKAIIDYGSEQVVIVDQISGGTILEQVFDMKKLNSRTHRID